MEHPKKTQPLQQDKRVFVASGSLKVCQLQEQIAEEDDSGVMTSESTHCPAQRQDWRLRELWDIHSSITPDGMHLGILYIHAVSL